ncbi:TDP-N-acetylfucosamine:lipid II N-acetylfucosaminyltransferase [Aliarcobacter vitoriensis]|uniref:TDP-N-acetylfucosamine:lipid II N-acetylfucosaminyltransferase n=1 Tax=Aliarcobacter vitoriensis TaxID=2011099 RepID=A0A366MX06_9BACT|nr:TDP-N-acetylfucosamine:lipid II N-acetylfucosaminyltransferase [Aliarcobacter vitoriensis]RBQ30134.1 hypothetical protein CRU91_00375 [Aliarcobacter vitoriensis]
MSEHKILHVMILDKFLAPFIDFVDEHFGRENHHYVFITSEKYDYRLTPEHKVEFLHTDDDIFITLLEYMKMAKKIILHGLWRDKVNVLLYFNQELLKKCYWITWGGDFYFPETKSKIQHQIIKNIGNYITGVVGDSLYIKKYYKAKGYNIHCYAYPSNLYKNYNIEIKKHNTINIQLGNSADPTNNHYEVLKKLLPFKNENIKIFAPLSYGDKKYANQIIMKGQNLFKDKFIPLTEFMLIEEYHKFLNSIDIAIFAHNRQQAIGNIITLLGLGKKVYIKNDITSWEHFKNINVQVFDIASINLEILDEQVIYNNIQKIKEYYSESNLKAQLEIIFKI